MRITNNTLAAFLMTTSSFFYSLQYLDIKILSPHYSLWFLIFSRSLSSLMIASCYLIFIKKRNLLGMEKTKLMIRGVLGGITSVASFYTMRHLDISTATIILSLTPITSAFLSVRTGMEWKTSDSVSVCLSLSGITILMAPSKSEVLGVLAGIMTTVLHACVNVTLHDIRGEDPVVISTYSMISCLLFSLPWIFLNRRDLFLYLDLNRTPWTMVEWVAMGVISTMAQTLKTMAIQYSETMGILIFRYMDVLFSMIWDLSIFHRPFHLYELMSFTLIMGGCIIQIYT